MPGTPSRKAARLEARITSTQKRIIQRAAKLRGMSISHFVVSTAEQAAKDTLRESDVTALRGEAQAAFVEALLNPPMPTPAAVAAAKRHRDRLRKSVA